MILCLDVGNSHIFAGVFANNELILRFRMDSKQSYSSDQYGVFMKAVLRENGIDGNAVTDIAMCSVVPNVDYSLKAACMKYFNIQPFSLEAGVRTGLKIKYRNPLEVGADRIANAIGATRMYPGRNLIIVDFGTATTLCVVSKDKDYHGGAIMAGIKLCMKALELETAKLFPVAIVKPKAAIARSTTESIQAGLYYGQCAAIRELIIRARADFFSDEEPLVIGTGGFAYLFEDEQLYAVLLPDLVLQGLRIALDENRTQSSESRYRNPVHVQAPVPKGRGKLQNSIGSEIVI